MTTPYHRKPLCNGSQHIVVDGWRPYDGYADRVEQCPGCPACEIDNAIASALEDAAQRRRDRA